MAIRGTIDCCGAGPETRGAEALAPDSRGAEAAASRGAEAVAPESRGAEGVASSGAEAVAPDGRGAEGAAAGAAPDTRAPDATGPLARIISVAVPDGTQEIKAPFGKRVKSRGP